MILRIERISDNQIRCTLSRSDLADRQIELSELAYGSEKARRLFHELIQAAADEVGFDVENVPVMVEAIPLSMDSIMLVVTRVEDPDELDTRFSRFSPAADEDWGTPEDLSELAAGLLEGAAGLRQLQKELADSRAAQNEKTAQHESPEFCLFAFESLDAAAEAAAALRGVIMAHSTLFKDSGTYYLCVTCADNEDNFRRICNTLSEYGAPQRSLPGSLAYLEEHCEILVKARALDRLAALA